MVKILLLLISHIKLTDRALCDIHRPLGAQVENQMLQNPHIRAG